MQREKKADARVRSIGPVATLALLCAALAMLGPRAADGAQGPSIAAVSPTTLGLGNELKVTIDGLEAAIASGVDPASFRLRLNGHRFADVMPEHTGANQVSFDLSNLRKDAAGWLLLAGSPPFTGARNMKFEMSNSGVDIEGPGGRPLDVTFRIFEPWKLAVSVMVVAAVIAALGWLGARTGMLRETSAAVGLENAPYSLSRCQMAFWFMLILGCFLGLWVVTGEFNNIVSTQSLVLMGISSVTAAGAIAIESRTAAPAPYPKRSVLKDLLTDDAGWAFHRIQIAAWTLVLGTVSLSSAYSNLTLPTFDSNLLILMGISSGLYLTMKYPERQTGKELPEDANAAAPKNSTTEVLGQDARPASQPAS